MAEHADDSEGELLARVRALIGPQMPLVASLDLHANVTQRMLREADALVSYRTYPHVDMADTGALAAQLLARRFKLGRKEAQHARRFPFLIPINAQSTWLEPARSLYDELVALDREHGTVSSFCMGFPASDFDECAPMIWSHGERAEHVADALFAARQRAHAMARVVAFAARCGGAGDRAGGQCVASGGDRRHAGQPRRRRRQQHHRHAARAGGARRRQGVIPVRWRWA